ncbi:MAG: hypothetical protein GX259_09030 [Bacteroidales bacterium]|nr:hypothetical protein [Bacteroidales bacterium]
MKNKKGFIRLPLLLMMGAFMVFTISCKNHKLSDNGTVVLLENSFKDTRDGNIYKTVKIGDQVWMAENLKYLPSVVGPDSGSTTVPLYYVYGYNGTNIAEAKATDNYKTYGVLYNWSAAMASNSSGVEGVCPCGWHLPSDAEWKQLEMYLGMTKKQANAVGWRGTGVGGKLKEADTLHWRRPNTGATNESGFAALPGGYRSGGNFYNIGNYAVWWTATESDERGAWNRYMRYDYSKVYRNCGTKYSGYSVRCVKD